MDQGKLVCFEKHSLGTIAVISGLLNIPECTALQSVNGVYVLSKKIWRSKTQIGVILTTISGKNPEIGDILSDRLEEVAPPAEEVAPPAEEVAPPAPEVAPPAPPAPEVAPPAPEVAPPAPPADEVAPPADEVAPPADEVARKKKKK